MDVDGSETDTPPQTIKPISFIDATLLHRPPPPPMAAAYKECMKNHAAEIGGHAVDGCSEFMQSDSPSPSSAAASPTSLTCAACGCRRNFHRRDPESTSSSAAITPPFLNFRHPPLPKRFSISLSHSPPSPSSTPTPPETHARNVLFGLAATADNQNHRGPITPFGRKRHRTKFSEEQKEKMQSFAAELGWRMQKSDEAAVREFCREIGVSRGVLKVWMHNNKNTFCKNETNGGGITKDGGLRFESSGGGDEEEI